MVAGREKADVVAELRQAEVGIVLTENETVFSAGGEHAIGLGCALGDEVIDEDTDVSLIAAQDDRVLALNAPGGVHPSYKSLGTSFFVAGCAIDLASAIEVAADFGFERRIELGWEGKVVFDGVGWAKDLGVFATANRPDEIMLDVDREAS